MFKSFKKIEAYLEQKKCTDASRLLEEYIRTDVEKDQALLRVRAPHFEVWVRELLRLCNEESGLPRAGNTSKIAWNSVQIRAALQEFAGETDATRPLFKNSI